MSASRDERLLACLLHGSTVKAAAAEAGCSERTARRRLADDGFRKRLEQLQAESLDAAVSALGAAATTAVERLRIAMLPPAPAAIQLAASKAVLAFAFRSRERDFDELERRVLALERR